MDTNHNSTEYQDIVEYMTSVLGNEFPIEAFTPEYLMLSIMDNTTCHANTIIDNLLMSDTLDYLRSYYIDRIKELDKKPILSNGPKVVKFNKELSAIVLAAVKEASHRKSSKVGTEDLLLAILNEDNGFAIADKLIELGLRYEYIYDKCNEYSKNKKSTTKHTKKMKSINESYVSNDNDESSHVGKMPLKSEINSRTFVQNGNTPYINKYTINLHEEIENGHYDTLVGRDEILSQIVRVLSRRRKNNVILVGKPGCGKTSICYKLAEMIDSGNIPDILEGKQVVMLDSMALLSGTHLRGMFEERVDGLFKELKANPNYILVIDDMQNVVRNTGKDKDGDLSDVIGNVLAEGDVRVVGTISFKDYRNGIEQNSVLSTKLQKIIVEPSSKEETFQILSTNKHYYENFHHVKFSDACIQKAIQLADRYITNNNLPDSAIDVIDLTGASISLNNKQSKTLKGLKEKIEKLDEEKKTAMNSGDFEKLDDIAKKESKLQREISDVRKKIDNDDTMWLRATESNIEDAVSSMTNIPVHKLKSEDKTTIVNIDKILKQTVIGQDEAIDEIARAIKRSKAGFGDNNKSTGVILAIGGTGVGKTLIAKQLAKNIYGDEKALIRFDMSEYQDKTSVNKLIGSNAGYVGYENGGLLTEAIKNKPYCVLLFDEIEKADESIYNLFLQLFDEGRLTDNNGVTVNFKNVIVIMTSNVGAKQASEMGDGVGFYTNTLENKKSIIEKALKNKFNPEFLNRIDKIVYFNNLTDENLREVTKLELNKVCNRVKENGVSIEYDDKVVDYVYSKALDEKEFGARPIMRVIQDNISDRLVDLVLTTTGKKNSFSVTVDANGEILARRR